MTDRIALVLGAIIIAAIAGDIVANNGSAIMFLLRKFTNLVEWIAFWR